MSRVQLVVTRLDNEINFYAVPPGAAWRINPAFRCIVIGRFPRTYIPLDTVACFVVEPIEDSGPQNAGPATGA